MEKLKKQRKSSISKNEYELIEKVQKFKVFDVSLIQKLTGYKKTKIYQLVFSLKKKGVIIEIKKGNYILSFLDYQPDISSVVCRLFWPSYISFWTALSYYKFTEQLPTTIFLASTKIRKEMEILNTKISFIKLSPKRFFGYEKIDDMIIAEKEKALIDSLLLPRYSGGIEEVFKSLYNAWDEIDKKVLISYALKMGNKSLLKRLGYLVEIGKLKIDKMLLNKLKREIGKGYSKLDPNASKRGKYNKKWNLIVNIERDLFKWREIL